VPLLKITSVLINITKYVLIGGAFTRCIFFSDLTKNTMQQYDERRVGGWVVCWADGRNHANTIKITFYSYYFTVNKKHAIIPSSNEHALT
jgi:hypothetical protein